MGTHTGAEKLTPGLLTAVQEKKACSWLVERLARVKEQTGDPFDRLVTLGQGVLALYALDTLATTPAETRSGWTRLLSNFQDSPGEMFGKPEGDVWAVHPAQDSSRTLVGAFFITQALAALGEKPQHRLDLPVWLWDAKLLRAWLDRLDWSQARPASEAVMAVLGLLLYQFQAEPDDKIPAAYHAILDRLVELQDPRTGLWGVQNGDSLANGLVAGFNLLPFFHRVHRPVMHLSRIVDSGLHILLSNRDLFTCGCQELFTGVAAAGLLALLQTRLHYRQDEIRQVLAEISRVLIHQLDSSGSFGACSAAGIDPPGAPWLSASPDQNEVACALVHLIGLRAARRLTSDIAGMQPGPGFPVFAALFDTERNPGQDEALLHWLRPFSNRELPVLVVPKVSVIIPVYNQGIYLYEAIQSVLSQTYRDYELILVNDGSTDGFTNFMMDHLDLPGVRVIRQPNRGLAAARNAGIRQARGRYICCLDCDDRLRPAYFATAVPHLERDPGIGFITGLLETFDEMSGVYRYHEFEFHDLLADNQVIEPALFRKEAWEKAGGYCETFSHPGIEDWDLWISIYEAGYRACFVNEVLYDYRIRADAMSSGMFQPAIWEKMSAELVQRHAGSYTTHFTGVIQRLNVRWVEMKNWAKAQDQAVAWWERQSGTWQYSAAHKDREIQRLQAWIHELQVRPGGAADQSDNSIPDGFPASALPAGAHGAAGGQVRSGLVNFLYRWWVRFGRRFGFIGEDWKV